MPLNLIGPAGLFTRLGHLIYGVDDVVNMFRGTSLPGRTDVIQEDYKDVDQNLIDGLYSQLSSAQSSPSMAYYWKGLAQSTVTQMINSYQPQYKYDYRNALGFLFDYMINNNETVVRNTVSVTVTPDAGNKGNGIVLVSPYNNLGLPQEYMFNESVIMRVVRDYQGGASPGQETLQFNGVYGVTDPLHWLWPQGSNAQAILTAITPFSGGSAGTQNWLINGNMETFNLVPNVPDSWHVPTGMGVPGTSILKDTADFYDGVSAVRFVGDGVENTAIWTQFGVDFSGPASPADQLVVNLFYKLGSTPASGSLTVSLVDGTGTVLVDATGTDASFLKDLTGSDTVWHSLNGFLRMPTIIPGPVYLMISLDTPLPAGVALTIDRITMARPSFFYQGGPQIACFSGNSNWMLGDVYTIAVNNAFNGLIQSGCNKLLDLNTYGLVWPSTTGVATIPDTLVV